MNCNLSRTVRVYSWKNALLTHTYNMRNEYAKHMGVRVRSMEELLDQLQKNYAGIIDTMSKIVDPATPRNRAVKPVNRGIGRRIRMQETPTPEPTGERSSHCFLDSELLEVSVSSRLKSSESLLQMQQAYSLQLKAELEEMRKEAKATRAIALDIEHQIQTDQKEERTRWAAFIQEYRKATDSDLKGKDLEIEKLNQVLSVWVDRYLQLQDQGIADGQGRAQVRKTLEDVKTLCGWTAAAVQAARVLRRSETGDEITHLQQP